MSLAADLAPTGVLRASINLGNPVLAQGTPEAPSGVTVDLSRELASRLGVDVALMCFDAARKSFDALAQGRADLCFLAIDPARETEVAFSTPYVVIEGVYVVPAGSPITSAHEVDRPGVRVGVKHGSAYDLFLTRSLGHASVVRGEDGIDALREGGLEAGAGIRQPMTRAVSSDPGLRLLEPAFMQIRQAVGVPVSRSAESVAWVRRVVDELVESGWVADSLARYGAF
ncbi:ABC transporter substrate-binding protein [Nocardioides gansuensis]|uniref:ABC transporter substrate-binding protein n=1 Tax=Nocardioides gansuensis TaxID=2138300 RepID=A0A2T8FAB1_9ACTN|nr:transporter substrate-binding domain-containing protein [Nocardioides gansuensis]PVG82620.1 ABC transporter substrate-binding protein [Nocardioides gansuensis]